jgi:hypothetical protein
MLKTCGVKSVEMWAATVEAKVWAATVENLAKAGKWKTVKALFTLQLVPEDCDLSRVNYTSLVESVIGVSWLEHESLFVELLARKANPSFLVSTDRRPPLHTAMSQSLQIASGGASMLL